MTKIAIVRGLNDNVGIQIPDKMPFVNWLTTTAGENDLVLAKQRLWIYNYTQPKKAKLWAKGATMIDNALYAGIHGVTPYIGALPHELQFVAKALKFAKNKVAPAGEMLLRASDDLRKGLDLESVSIAGFDGFEEMKKAFPSCFRVTWNNQTGIVTRTNEVYPECQALLNFITQFNDKLPTTAHHSIYNSVPDAELNDRKKHTQVSVQKALKHKDFVGGLQVASQVDIVSLNAWLKNCIMWRNAQNNVEGILPESNINLLRQNPTWDTASNWSNPDLDQIGNPFIVILIIIVACKGIGGLIQIIKDKEPTAFAGLTEIAQAVTFAASGKDFSGLGNTTGGGSSGGGTTGDTSTKCDIGYHLDPVLNVCVKDDETPAKTTIINGVPDVITIGAGLGGLFWLAGGGSK